MTPEHLAYLIAHTDVQMGWLSAVLALAPLVSKLFTGASKARAEGRVEEAGLNAANDAAKINRAVVDNNLTQSKQNNAVQNALREGIQDFSITRPDGVPTGRATGGYRPSAITGVNSLGKQFKDADLASIMAGTPELTPLPHAGKLDKFLNIAGGLAGLAGLAGQAKSAFSGASSIPDVTTKVAEPLGFMNDVPIADMSFSAPARGSTYRAPKFTSRF